MTKEIPPTIDQITIEQLRWLEAALAFKRNMTRKDDENDSSPLRIRMPQAIYTPPPPKTPWLALAALASCAALAFAALWAAIALAFLL